MKREICSGASIAANEAMARRMRDPAFGGVVRPEPGPKPHWKCLGYHEKEDFHEESNDDQWGEKDLQKSLVEAHTRIPPQPVYVNAAENGTVHRSRRRIDNVLSCILSEMFHSFYLTHPLNCNRQVKFQFRFLLAGLYRPTDGRTDARTHPHARMHLKITKDKNHGRSHIICRNE